MCKCVLFCAQGGACVWIPCPWVISSIAVQTWRPRRRVGHSFRFVCPITVPHPSCLAQVLVQHRGKHFSVEQTWRSTSKIQDIPRFTLLGKGETPASFACPSPRRLGKPRSTWHPWRAQRYTNPHLCRWCACSRDRGEHAAIIMRFNRSYLHHMGFPEGKLRPRNLAIDQRMPGS